MRQRVHTLILVVMLLSLAGFCLAADSEAPAEETPAAPLAEEAAPLITDRDSVDPPPPPLLDTEPSSWSNVKALWG